MSTKHPVTDALSPPCLLAWCSTTIHCPWRRSCERVAPTQLRLTLTEGKYHQVKAHDRGCGQLRQEALHRAQMDGLALDPALRQGNGAGWMQTILLWLRAAP